MGPPHSGGSRRPVYGQEPFLPHPELGVLSSRDLNQQQPQLGTQGMALPPGVWNHLRAVQHCPPDDRIPCAVSLP